LTGPKREEEKEKGKEFLFIFLEFIFGKRII
jgi:hypothetical protein